MRTIFLAVAVLAFFFIVSCSNSDNGVVGSQLNVNLLSNPSFETNGAPSLHGWFAYDTSLVRFSPDAPPGEGNYSVAIRPGSILPGNDSIEGSVYTTVAAPAGTHQYRLTVWAKADKWTGDAYIDVLKLAPPAMPIYKETPAISDTVWMEYTLLSDTVTTNTGDSITVGLEVGSVSADTTGKIYFDMCTLEAIY